MLHDVALAFVENRERLAALLRARCPPELAGQRELLLNREPADGNVLTKGTTPSWYTSASSE